MQPVKTSQYSKLKELKAQHRSICQMSFNGFRNHEIAEKTGMTESTISCILRSPLGEAYINGMHDRVQEQTLDVRKQLIGMNKAALDSINRILDPKQKAPFNVQLTAAKDVLDRNGYKAPDKINVDMFVQKSDAEIDAEIAAMEAAIARTQNKNFSAPPIIEENQEVHPFPLDESDSDKTIQSKDAATLDASISERRESSLAASNISKDTDELNSLITKKLSDRSFDPFNNIKV